MTLRRRMAFSPAYHCSVPGPSTGFGQGEVLLVQVFEHRKPSCFPPQPGIREAGQGLCAMVPMGDLMVQRAQLWWKERIEPGRKLVLRAGVGSKVHCEFIDTSSCHPFLRVGLPCRHSTHTRSQYHFDKMLTCCLENNTELSTMFTSL